MEPTTLNRQQQIEARLAVFPPGQSPAGQTLREVYGELEDWMFSLGPWEFLLDPLSRHWFYRDPAHDQYLDTGYRAGEVVFELTPEGLFHPLPPPSGSP